MILLAPIVAQEIKSSSRLTSLTVTCPSNTCCEIRPSLHSSFYRLTYYFWVHAEQITAESSPQIVFIVDNVFFGHAPTNGSRVSSTANSVTPVMVLAKQEEWALVMSMDGLTRIKVLDDYAGYLRGTCLVTRPKHYTKQPRHLWL